MPKAKKQNSKKRQRIQTIEEDAVSITTTRLAGQHPDYYLWLLCIVVIFLGLLIWLGIANKPTRTENLSGANPITLQEAITDKSDLAKALESRLNVISPTPPTGTLGFIATEISFLTGQQQAYITYTDTHITLRMLVEFVYNTDSLDTKVLATFIPDEQGNWQLQYGKDLSGTVAAEDYAYDPVTEAWVLSDTNVAN